MTAAIPEDLAALFSDPTPDRLRAHVYGLAWDLDLTIHEAGVTWPWDVWTDGEQAKGAAFAIIDHGIIVLSEDPGSSSGYETAMHEIGHFLTWRGNDYMEDEEHAWEEAQRIALVPIAREHIERSLEVSRRKVARSDVVDVEDRPES